MKISAISQDNDNNLRRNFFIRYANSFMSAPSSENPVEKAGTLTPVETAKKPAKMGIENLQEFTIFPKQVVDGRTIITA